MDDSLLLMLIIIVLTLFFIILGFLISDNKNVKRFNRNPEEIVYFELEKIMCEFGGYLYNNICFEDNDGYSSELDHLFITKAGIFVIETKGYRGIISGKTIDSNWYSYNKAFINPVKQNDGHINHLKKILNLKYRYYSVIVFPLADEIITDNDNTFLLDDAIDFIKDEINNGKLLEKDINRIDSEINFLMKKYGISKEKHVENIKNTYS